MKAASSRGKWAGTWDRVGYLAEPPGLLLEVDPIVWTKNSLS